MRWKVLGAVLVVLAVASVVLAVTRNDATDAERTGGDRTHTAPTGTWEQVADAPLTPRANALVVWTGDEVLVIGGDTTPPCPPSAGCTDTGGTPPQDGAAYDPVADTWRPIADAPVPVSWGGEAAFADGVLYLRALDENERITRYDVAADRWDEIPAPPLMAARTLLADGDRLLAPLQLTAGLGDDAVDLAFDPATGGWTDLPIDPIRDAQARQIQSVDGRLYLIAGSLEPEADGMGADVHAALLDDGTWRQLPDPDTDGYLPSLAALDLIVSPQDDETAGDGDDVPGRWALDPTTDEWVDVPEIPSAEGPDVAGAWAAGDHHLFVSNLVLDTATRTWAPLGAPDELERRGAQAAAVGDRLFVFGGSRIDGDSLEAYADATLQHDAWIWTPNT